MSGNKTGKNNHVSQYVGINNRDKQQVRTGFETNVLTKSKKQIIK